MKEMWDLKQKECREKEKGKVGKLDRKKYVSVFL